MHKPQNPRILSAQGSLPTCREIRDAIERLTGIRFLISKPGSETQNVLFRYGNTDSVSGEDPALNSIEFIRLAAHKDRFAEFCQKNNIYSPIYRTFEERPANYPVIIRTTLTGFGGRGIIVCSNEDEFNQNMRRGYWWTEFVSCQFELRVHLFGENVNRIYKKMNPPDRQEMNLPIRNAENGYHFSLSSETNERYPKAIEVAKTLGKLFAPIGGKFCAIDMGWDSAKKQYFTFEINSAPGLNSINQVEYAKYICQQRNLEIRGEG